MVPKGWLKKSLKTITNEDRKITYGVLKPDEPSGNDFALMIRSQDYTYGWIPNDDVMKISTELDNEYRRSRVVTGDILITVVGANVGTIARLPERLNGANISRAVARISIDERKAIGDYAYYFLKSPELRRFIYNSTVGGAQPVVNLKDLNQFSVNLPPLPEQTKIARILSTWDRAIETTEKLIANSRQQKKALMQQLLTSKKRLPGFKGEWRFSRFNELFKVANDKAKQIPKSQYQINGGHPIVDQGQELVVAYTDSSNLYTRLPVVIFGDHTRIVKWIDFPFAPGADGTQILKPTSKCDPKYAYYMLSFMKLPNLGYSRHMRELKEREFKHPVSLEEQHSIAQILWAVDRLVDGYVNYRDSLLSQKNALMQQLLTGKRRVKVDTEAT